MDTLTQGRVDIVIFPNGGWEYIGRVPANPEIPEADYQPEVEKFVAQNQGLKNPTNFTGYYGVDGDILKMSWGTYAGEIPRDEVETTELTSEMLTELNQVQTQ